MRKRQRTDAAAPMSHDGPPPLPGPAVTEDTFITDQDAVDSGGEDDDDDEKPKSEKKAGRRKIKIEFIQDKSRRHITFSKRKAGMSPFYACLNLDVLPVLTLSPSYLGIMKKATLLPILSFHEIYFLSHIGIRAIDPHWHASSTSCRVRDRSGIHIYHRQASTSGHST